MGHYWSVRLPWTAFFDTECELCREFFTFTQGYVTQLGQGDSGSGGSRERAETAAVKKMMTEQRSLLTKYGNAGIFSLNTRRVEVHACPGCGYIQSWMIRRAKNQKNRFRKYSWLSGILLFLMAFPLLGSLNSPETFGLTVNLIVQLLTACLAILFVFSLYRADKFNRTFDPNAGVLQNHPGPIQKKPPRIRFSSDNYRYF